MAGGLRVSWRESLKEMQRRGGCKWVEEEEEEEEEEEHGHTFLNIERCPRD